NRVRIDGMAEGHSPGAATGNHDDAGAAASDERTTTELLTLVTQHHAAVYRYAVRLCGCPTEAEDLTPQTFLIVQRKLSQLRDLERAAAWLLTIVRNCYLKSRRKSRPIAAESVGLDMQ